MAWRIFKLKVVTAVLGVIVKVHIWWTLKDQNKVKDKTINKGMNNRKKFKPDMQGPDATMEHFIAKARARRKDDKL